MKNIMIIVESGNKINSISRYIEELKKDGGIAQEDEYLIAASVGHILELSRSWMPSLEEEEWDPIKKPIRGKASVIKELKAKAKKCDIVYVATDPDREGEAIAQDLIDKLEIKDKHRRMVFNEITKESILEALNDLSMVNEDLVKAQKARLLLDRMMGYRLSSWIQKKIWNATPRSAGRVQSPTLKLVVEREVAIEGFMPETFVKIEQVINDELVAPIVLKDHKIDGKSTQLDPKELQNVKSALTGELTVKSIKKSKRNGSLKVPFKQSAVYRAASSRFGMSAAVSRNAMQSLFEKGFISYPRTDSTRYSNSFIKKAQDFIKNKFGPEYVIDSIKGQAKGKQDAHEALRITDPKKTPPRVAADLTSQSEVNMYKLIYQHTLRTLMTPPLKELLTYVLEDGGYEFKLSSSKTIFTGYDVINIDDKGKELELPVLEEGQKLNSKTINYTPGQTLPPSRFNEGSLIEKMEEVGVGRPSTFSSTVGILQSRGYVDKVGNALIATRLGKAVALSLMIFFNGIIKENYTKSLENTLDKIAIGEKEYKETLNKFWTRLQEELNHAHIKYKEENENKTQIIKVNDVKEAEEIKPNRESPENYGFYSKPYMDLLIIFTKYVSIVKKTIEVDWESFIKEAKEIFIGPIMMPLFPKRGAYLKNKEGKVEEWFKNKDYTGLEVCPKCKANPVIFRGALRKGRISWFKTCSGFPKYKCNFIESIDEKFQGELEAFYLAKIEEFKSEDQKRILEYTQKLNLKKHNVEMTQTILLSELKNNK